MERFRDCGSSKSVGVLMEGSEDGGSATRPRMGERRGRKGPAARPTRRYRAASCACMFLSSEQDEPDFARAVEMRRGVRQAVLPCFTAWKVRQLGDVEGEQGNKVR